MKGHETLKQQKADETINAKRAEIKAIKEKRRQEKLKQVRYINIEYI